MILVEKLLMVIAITLLQRYTATAQVLVALIIVSLATVLHITFRPSGCTMLHTLQRSSLYVLQATLFMMMLSNLSEVADNKVILLALAIAAALNIGLVIMFLFAFAIEVRRLIMVSIDADPAERMRWAHLRQFARDNVFGACAGARRKTMAAAAAPRQPPQPQPMGQLLSGPNQV